MENAAVIRQSSYNNFTVLKNHPALKFINDISIDTLEKKYGRNPKDFEKGDILVGRNVVFLTQKAWLQLEKSLETSSKGESAIDDAGSEHDSDTVSHYGSEFEAPQIIHGLSTYENRTKGLTKNKAAPIQEQKRPPTSLRKNWLAFVWTVTFCFFPFCLRICRMKDRERQIAWREKVALCLIIFLMNASLLFLIIGTGWLICPATPQLSPGQISSYTNYDNTALVYMYGSYYSIFEIITAQKHQDQQSNKEFWQAEVFGRDVSVMFPKDFNRQTWEDFW